MYTTPVKTKPFEEGYYTLYRGGYSVYDSPSFKKYGFGYFTRNREKALNYSKSSNYKSNPNELWSYDVDKDINLLTGEELQGLLHEYEEELTSIDNDKAPFTKDENNQWKRISQDSKVDMAFFYRIQKKVVELGFHGIDMQDYEEVLIYDMSKVQERKNRVVKELLF
jgi:hypothetical protein